MAAEITFKFPLPYGLHARPASYLEETARQFRSSIQLTNEKTGQTTGLNSVLGMVALDIHFEDPCRMTFCGTDENEACDRMKVFLQVQFPRCDDPLPPASAPEGEISLPPSMRNTGVTIWRGTALVGGIGIGRLVRIARTGLSNSLPLRGPVNREEEQRRIDKALTALAQSFDEKLAQRRPETETMLLKAHRAMALDPEFKGRLRTALEEPDCTAAGAVAATEAHFAAMLAASRSALLRERVLDVEDVCRQLLRCLYGAAAVPESVSLISDSIVVADNLAPGQLLDLKRFLVKGLVLRNPSSTSHTVILARSFGIPTLVGAVLPAGSCPDGLEVVLDGEIGAVVAHLNDAARRFYTMEQRRLQERRARHERFIHQAGRTLDGVSLPITANISSAAEAESAMAAGAEAVGLLRTEMLYLERSQAPSEDVQYEEYRKVLAAAGGKPVTIRTFDVGGDKAISYWNLPHEDNPFLGCRAVRLYPQLEGVFRIQIRALLRAAAHGNLKVLIPMITLVEEAVWIKEVVAQEQAKLVDQGIPNANIVLGAMIETPGAVFALEGLCREFDCFSIGTNDLLQHFMAADRTSEKVQSLYQPLAPAFMRLLKMAVDSVHRHGKSVTLCGELGNQPRFLPLLAGLGFDGISMAVPAITVIKAELSLLSAVECRRLLAQTLDCFFAKEVMALLDRHSNKQPVPLVDPDLIIVDSPATDKAEAIKEICDLLYVLGRTDRPLEIEEALWQRENTYSTGFGEGFAIPHCRTSALLADSLALLKLRKPVEWQASDGKPVSTVLLLAISESDPPSATLNILARLARRLMHADFRDQLTQEANAKALAALLAEELGDMIGI